MEGSDKTSFRMSKLEYLQHTVKTVGVLKQDGEYEIKPTEYCQKGDLVYVIESDNSFTRVRIY